MTTNMTLTPHREKELREEWNKKFPPPMLLGQNQEKVADYWLTIMKSEINKVLEGVEKDIAEFPSRCRLCEKQGVNTFGECECSYEDKQYWKKKDAKEIINKYKQ